MFCGKDIFFANVEPSITLRYAEWIHIQTHHSRYFELCWSKVQT